MMRFLSIWFVLASAYLVAAFAIDAFTGLPIAPHAFELAVMALVVSLAQTAVLQFFALFSHPRTVHENPDQHR